MKFTLALIAAPLLSLPLHAATILYNLRDTSQTVDIEAGAYTVDSVLLTMNSPQGVLNQTGTGFGVNATGSGDNTHQIDNGAGVAEVLNFSFDASGTLTQIDMSSYGSSDTFDLKKNGVLILSMTDQGTSSPDIFTLNEAFVSTDTFSITFTGGNGASLDAFTITTVPVPEPSTAMFLVAFATLGLVRRRR